MHYAEIKKYDIANGPGLRDSLFVSGCTHKCPECFNQEAWDPNYGQVYNRRVEIQLLEHLKDPYIAGLSILGGDPLDFDNYKNLIHLVEKTKKMGKDIWVYTGETLQKIVERVYNDKDLKRFLDPVDVVVEGPFMQSLKDPELKFRGSSNQHIVNYQVIKKMIDENSMCAEDLNFPGTIEYIRLMNGFWKE